jgi:hypothetical protein
MQNTTSVHPFPGTADHTVVGLLPNVDAVRQALETLRAHGISDDQIGLAMQQVDSDLSSEGEDAVSPTAQDAAKGAVGGGIIGGLAGLLTATGVVAVPGLAPLLAGGALISLLGATGASIVAGSGVGAVAGGLVGALVSINVPESAARQYEEAVRGGKILLTVRTDGETKRIQDLLALHGAETEIRA